MEQVTNRKKDKFLRGEKKIGRLGLRPFTISMRQVSPPQLHVFTTPEQPFCLDVPLKRSLPHENIDLLERELRDMMSRYLL